MSATDLGSHPVRSFVRREGRMTDAQKRALMDLWSIYGIDNHGAPLGKALFSEPRELTLEIGFGDGEALVNLAKQQPEAGFIGIDPLHHHRGVQLYLLWHLFLVHLHL